MLSRVHRGSGPAAKPQELCLLELLGCVCLDSANMHRDQIQPLMAVAKAVFKLHSLTNPQCLVRGGHDAQEPCKADAALSCTNQAWIVKRSQIHDRIAHAGYRRPSLPVAGPLSILLCAHSNCTTCKLRNTCTTHGQRWSPSKNCFSQPP